MTNRITYRQIANAVRFGEAWEARRNRAGHTPRRTIISYVVADLRAAFERFGSEVA